MKEILEYISTLQTQSFEGWSDDSIEGYKTALISIQKEMEKINSTPETILVNCGFNYYEIENPKNGYTLAGINQYAMFIQIEKEKMFEPNAIKKEVDKVLRTLYFIPQMDSDHYRIDVYAQYTFDQLGINVSSIDPAFKWMDEVSLYLSGRFTIDERARKLFVNLKSLPRRNLLY